MSLSARTVLAELAKKSRVLPGVRHERCLKAEQEVWLGWGLVGCIPGTWCLSLELLRVNEVALRAASFTLSQGHRGLSSQ